MRAFIALMLLSVSAAAADTPTQPIATWYPGMVGEAYLFLCESVFDGTYAQTNPTFLQGWECSGITNLCEVRPETFGCNRPEPR